MDVISDKTDVLKILPEAAEELCTALLRNSPAGIYITRNGKFIYTNIEFRRLTGYTQGEIAGQDYQKLINPRYREMPKQNIASLFEEADSAVHEFKIIAKDGKQKWIAEKITYFKYGGTWLTLGHWLDISKQHAIERAWHEAERRFQAAFEDLSAGMAIVSIDGIFLKANKSFFDMTGYDEREILESHFDEILLEDERQTSGDLMELFVSLEKPEEPVYQRLICKDGRAIWVAMSISLIGDSEGAPSYFIIHFNDITEQKRIEAGIKEEEHLYRSLVDNSIEPVMVADLDGHITHASQKLLSMLGYDDITGFLGKKFSSFLTSEEGKNIETWILDCLKQGTPGNKSCYLIKQDGSRIPAEIRLSWIKNQVGLPSHIIISLNPGTARDANQSIVNEDRLKRLLAMDSAASAIALAEEDTTITAVNTAFEKLSGYPREEIEGKKSWVDFVAGDDLKRLKRYYLLRRLDPGTAPDTYEFKFVRQDGEIKDVRITLCAVPGTNKTTATLTDITADKIAEQERLKKDKHSLDKLKKTADGIIETLTRIAEMRDPGASGHQKRVAALAGAIAREMNLPEEQVNGVITAGKIHDVGKILIPAELLNKPGYLTEIETRIVQTHAQGSYDLLKPVEFPWPVAEICYQHHERLNGSGYPRGLTGQDIMLESKILMVADVVETMSSPRPYHPCPGIVAALEEIERNSGILYDPDVVEACIKLFREKGFTFEIASG